jgi:hypothetical protein
MNLLRFILLLQLMAPLGLGQTAGNGKPPSLPNQPEALVQSLYSEVVALHPLGSPGGASIKTFAPYLSKALLHRIDINVACQDDWDRQNPDPNSKPPFLEFGLYTGDDLRAEPTTFHIERAQAEKDGSVRVYVKLTRDDPSESPQIWNVAAILVRENGHLVVDDVIWLKAGPRDVDVPLSEYLSDGCDGPHWVGFKKPQGDRKQQR